MQRENPPNNASAPPPQIEDEVNTPAYKYCVNDPGKEAFGDVMERTEKMLLFELMTNNPTEKGIGRFEFSGKFKVPTIVSFRNSFVTNQI